MRSEWKEQLEEVDLDTFMASLIAPKAAEKEAVRLQVLMKLLQEGPRLVVVLDSHVAGPAGNSLTPRATILSAPSRSGRCSFRASSGAAVILASTSSGVVKITGVAASCNFDRYIGL